MILKIIMTAAYRLTSGAELHQRDTHIERTHKPESSHSVRAHTSAKISLRALGFTAVCCSHSPPASCSSCVARKDCSHSSSIRPKLGPRRSQHLPGGGNAPPNPPMHVALNDWALGRRVRIALAGYEARGSHPSRRRPDGPAPRRWETRLQPPRLCT